MPLMNVFVLCSGRCGSLAFAKACSHITNFSSGHESNCHKLGSDRLTYPENHIEVDNRLSWFPGNLSARYTSDVFFVHLTRNEHDTAVSYAKRKDRGIMKAYGRSGVLLGIPPETPPFDIALDYVQNVNANIRQFLSCEYERPGRSSSMTFSIELAAELFPKFCESIGAEVDIKSALCEFEKRHNASD